VIWTQDNVPSTSELPPTIEDFESIFREAWGK